MEGRDSNSINGFSKSTTLGENQDCFFLWLHKEQQSGGMLLLPLLMECFPKCNFILHHLSCQEARCIFCWNVLFGCSFHQIFGSLFYCAKHSNPFTFCICLHMSSRTLPNRQMIRLWIDTLFQITFYLKGHSFSNYILFLMKYFFKWYSFSNDIKRPQSMFAVM